jgi:uncharacterized protein RhaS with RHS repeats
LEHSRPTSVGRYYDPATGQFLTVDPLVDETGQPYAYTGGDPVNAKDPAGTFTFDPEGGAGGGSSSSDDDESIVDALASGADDVFVRFPSEVFGWALGGQASPPVGDVPTASISSITSSDTGCDSVAAEGGDAAATTSADMLQDPQALEGLTPSQVDDLARNAGYDILPGKAGAANPATRYYVPGTNGSEGFRVLPSGVAGQEGMKGGAYLRFFGGPFAGLRIPLASP